MSDWWNFKKKLPYAHYLRIFSILPLFSGIRIRFLKLCQLIIFSRILKQMAPNCSEERSPNIQLPKWFCIHHIKGREPLNLHINNFLGVSWSLKVHGLPPPNVVNTKSFWYLDIRGLLFQTIWCHLFQNPRKNDQLTQFQKTNPYPRK